MENSYLRTIPQALDFSSEREGYGFTFIGEDRSEDLWTFARLSEHTRAVAALLTEKGMKPGDRVALILPQAADFVPTFLSVIRGGGVPVPLYPPMGLGQLGGYLNHAKHIVGASKSRFVIASAQIKAVIGGLHAHAPVLEAIWTPADLVGGDASRFTTPDVSLSDTCFLQFTSGSTSAPKGVVVTHENLAHNSWAIMQDGLQSTEEDRGLSWLPLFHDMGLIGFVLAPMAHQVPVGFLSPLMFLKRPATWLEYLSKTKATITYGPNFSYAITQKRVRERDLLGIDLSKVRVAGCGAEPIQSNTLRAFAERFSAVGFKESAFVPSYGMAENTLAIAFSYGLPTHRVDPDRLWTDGIAEESTEADPVEIVGCGGAFPGHGIRIVDPVTREIRDECTVGEIEISGPSVTPGYFENPEATAKTINKEGWLRTGDLGYLKEGQIFICGREKDVIIVNGKNYYPQDLEWAAGAVEGVRTGNAIAFAAYREGLDREAVVVVAETKEKEGLDEIATRVRAAVKEATSLTVDEVQLVEAGTLPKTSSGKVQRQKARARFEAGTLKKDTPEGATKIAGRVVQSQLSHLRLRIFGPRKRT